MSSPAHSGHRAGRHAGGRCSSFGRAGRRVKKAALGGLFGGVTLAVAYLVSRLLFHRDLAGGQGWAAFVTEFTSLLIAVVFTQVAAVVLAALNVHPFRRRPGRPGGRAGVR